MAIRICSSSFIISSSLISCRKTVSYCCHQINVGNDAPVIGTKFLQHLSAKQVGQVELYVDCLLQWNQRMNLTAVKERDMVMDRHVEDSLALLPVIEDSLSKYCSMWTGYELKVVDIGSGAGLPGMMLAIARPEWHLTLLDSTNKKCNFLRHVVQTLGLLNVEVVCARAEEKGHDTDFREAHHIAVARAVAEMHVLVELCLPFVRVGGLLIAAKGAGPEAEVESAKMAASLMGASIMTVSAVASKGPFGLRSAVLCVKTQNTPSKYPRRNGVPMKCPL